MQSSSSKLFQISLWLIFSFFYAVQTDPFLLSNRIHSLKYLWSTRFDGKDIGTINIRVWEQDRISFQKYKTKLCSVAHKKAHRYQSRVIHFFMYFSKPQNVAKSRVQFVGKSNSYAIQYTLGHSTFLYNTIQFISQLTFLYNTTYMQFNSLVNSPLSFQYKT